jgi:hypothetical protein
VSEPVSPLDPRLLAALRAERPAPRDGRARVRGRLEAAIPEMRRGGNGGGQGGGANGGTERGVAGVGPHTLGIVAFVLGAVTGAALFAAMAGTHPPPPRVVYVDRPAPPVAAPALQPPPATASPMTTMAPPPTPEPPATRLATTWPAAPAQPAAARPAAATHGSRLTEERILLDEARAGLIQGEPERAIERLDRHRVRFADGVLAEERDAMQVEALARAGRYDEARERASAFRARMPGSLFLPTVESAIGSVP